MTSHDRNPVRSHHLSGLQAGQRFRVNSFTALANIVNLMGTAVKPGFSDYVLRITHLSGAAKAAGF
jgi:hypothetical protein